MGEGLLNRIPSPNYPNVRASGCSASGIHRLLGLRDLGPKRRSTQNRQEYPLYVCLFGQAQTAIWVKKTSHEERSFKSRDTQRKRTYTIDAHSALAPI